MTALVLSLTVPAQAFAIVLAPPGKAGADQYFETIPTSAGNAAPPAGGTPGTPTPGTTLATTSNGRAGERGLTKLGHDGQAAAALAAATAPPSTHGLTSGGSASSAAGSASAANTSGSASVGVGDLLSGSDSGGIGLFLPLTMLLGLAGAIFVAIRRGRSHPEPPQHA